MEEDKKSPPPPPLQLLPPWQCLPANVLWDISRKTGDAADFVRFCVVCKHWRSAAWPTADECGRIGMELPWFILPDTFLGVLNFYSLAHGRRYRQHSLPEARGKLLCGLSHEWLALFDPRTKGLSLLHPITRARIPLPPIDWSSVPGAVQESEEEARVSLRNCLRNMEAVPFFYDCYRYREEVERLIEYKERYVTEVILSSSDPKGADSVVMAILGNSQLYAFCRLTGSGKGRGWTIVDPDLDGKILDVKYVNGHFHVVETFDYRMDYFN